MKNLRGKLFISLAAVLFLSAVSLIKVNALATEESGLLPHEKANKYGGGYAVTRQLEGVGYAAYVYDATNGLPTSDAMYILGSTDGYIWIGGYSGVVRYDGTTFERLDTSKGLTSARAIFEDSHKRIWVGTNDNGVVLIEGNERRQFTVFDGLPSSSIRSFAEDPRGNILVGTTQGLCYIDDELKVNKIENGILRTERILKMETGIDGKVYGHTGNGNLFTVENLSVTSVYSSRDLGMAKITTFMIDPYHVGNGSGGCAV